MVLGVALWFYVEVFDSKQMYLVELTGGPGGPAGPVSPIAPMGP